MGEVGYLVIVSGPSGAGKSTVVRELISKCDLPIELSISVTTRPARLGEVAGRDYHFVTAEQFESLRRENAFLECKQVFGQGQWYGTLRKSVDDAIAAGKWILLEIDVQGAMDVIQQRPETLTFFVHPGSLAELETRLRGRGSESETAIQRRLMVAETEMAYLPRYNHEIINRTVEQAAAEICQHLHQYQQEYSDARRS